MSSFESVESLLKFYIRYRGHFKTYDLHITVGIGVHLKAE